MARHLIFLLACVIAMVQRTYGLGLDYGNELDDPKSNELSAQSRFFIVLGNNGLNLTQLAALAALAAAALIPLLGLAALAMLLCALIWQKQNDDGGTGYGHTGGYGSHGGGGGGGGGYSSYSYRAFDGIDREWETLSIMDYISIAEDAYRNFDPTDLECHKKVICELHQNQDSFGPVAKTVNHYFSFLQYAEVLSLPEELKSMSEELLDAADRGRSLKKDCGDIFPGCEFSVKRIMDKYGHMNVTANAI